MNMEKNNAPLLEMRNIKKGFFGNQVLTDINFTLKAVSYTHLDVYKRQALLLLSPRFPLSVSA